MATEAHRRELAVLLSPMATCARFDWTPNLPSPRNGQRAEPAR